MNGLNLYSLHDIIAFALNYLSSKGIIQMTSQVVNEVVSAAEQVAPNAPVVEAAAAAISTIADPNPATILADIELAISLVKQFKANLADLHPSVINLIKALF